MCVKNCKFYVARLLPEKVDVSSYPRGRSQS